MDESTSNTTWTLASTLATKSETIINNYLQGVLKDIMSILRAECGSIFIFDNDKKELILKAFYNSHELNIAQRRLKMGEGIAGKVADTRKPVLVKDIDFDDRFQHNGFTHYRTNSFMSIPLLSPRGLLGIMNISDKTNKEPFSDKDFAFVVMLCRYACIIADNLASSERMAQEKEAFNDEKQLLEKYATVGKLAAGIVHEVNNPLDGIIRYTNILLTKINLDEVAREYLNEIKKGLNRIAKTTKSLLAFSHQVNSTGKAKSYVSISELVVDSLDVFNSKISLQNIQVSLALDNNLPRIADFGISHVSVNIVKNAIDAMPDGGKLEISSGLKDDMIFISFKDNGKGIPDEIKGRIFEPFFTTKSIIQGTGLGLAISHEIITKYGGKIEFHSQVGQGTEFTVLLPKENLENA
ncbi:MAG TPA: ATP-binding protein [Candidatus Omnitrophota bacterium]|nr:ATP-binding protein [Candidatus Omnitrophota bacterium]